MVPETWRIWNGVNTAARIVGACRPLRAKLLVSEAAADVPGADEDGGLRDAPDGGRAGASTFADVSGAPSFELVIVDLSLWRRNASSDEYRFGHDLYRGVIVALDASGALVWRATVGGEVWSEVSSVTLSYTSPFINDISGDNASRLATSGGDWVHLIGHNFGPLSTKLEAEY